jgi:prepilin peptidase CpaA
MIRDVIILGLFPVAMAFAAISDLLTMSISNRLTSALALGFFGMAVLIGMPLADVGFHVLASVIVLTICFGFFAFGWIGGGDAKLAAATTLWLGFAHLPKYLFLAAIIGGALTLILISLRARPLPLSLIGIRWVERLHSANSGIPYGIALAAAGLAVYPQTLFMLTLAG